MSQLTTIEVTVVGAIGEAHDVVTDVVTHRHIRRGRFMLLYMQRGHVIYVPNDTQPVLHGRLVPGVNYESLKDKWQQIDESKMYVNGTRINKDKLWSNFDHFARQ